MRDFLIVGLALGMMATSVHAGDWYFIADVGAAQDEYIVYVDKSSIEGISRSSAMSAWTLTVFHDDQSFESDHYRSEKQHIRVDCGKGLVGIEKRMLYSRYGGMVHQARDADPELTPPAPDSALQTAVTFICSAGRQPARTIPVYDPNKDAEQRFWLKDKERRIKPPEKGAAE